MLDRKKPDKDLMLCCGIFLVYAVLTFIGAATHELWFDEAQAWDIARDNDIKGIFRQLGYEGHPPLWYLILYIPAHIGLSCGVIPYISWFITGLAGALVLFRAPFNLITRSALLFSGGFLYINSVMSRVYCLVNLFIVLIAVLYPQRKKYPVLYGMLIALLANTHVFMCGFIGILGIFMLIDLFKDIKGKETKQIIKELAGLAIAGIGVLMLVLPLLNSLSLNNSAGEKGLLFPEVLVTFLGSFSETSLFMLEYGGRYTESAVIAIPEILSAGLLGVMMIVMMILMRHKTRPFLMLLFFWFFFTITTLVLWLMVPNRALIFAEMFFIAAWIAESEPQNSARSIWEKGVPKTDTRLLGEIIGKLALADREYRRVYIVLMTAVLIFSIPTAAVYLFGDYVKPFCPSEQAAEFVKENLPKDSVFVTNSEDLAQLSAYLPGYEFYALDYGRFYTYNSHEVLNEGDEADYGQIYNDLKDREHLYFVYVHNSPDYEVVPDGHEEVFIVRDGMPFGVNVCFWRIVEFTLEPGNNFWFIDDLYKLQSPKNQRQA